MHLCMPYFDYYEQMINHHDTLLTQATDVTEVLAMQLYREEVCAAITKYGST